jgi:hypothetical protein
MFVVWIFYGCVDTKNKSIMVLFCRIIGKIQADEDFDTHPLQKMRRRRLSSDFFVDSVEEIKSHPVLKRALKDQQLIYNINYKDKNEKIENLKKFSRIVLIVIHCIRNKVDEARNMRDEEFANRIGALENK